MALRKYILSFLRIIALLAGVLTLGIASGCLNWFIESQVFFPDRTIEQTPDQAGLTFEDVWFTSSDGVELHGWLVPANPTSNLLMFCHGNAGNISHRLDNILRLNSLGISVFIFDYRGYGLSLGKITEKGFYLDTEAAGREARKWAKKHKAKLIIFGRSLGSIAAVHLAANGSCNGLILESTFTNMGAVARTLYPLPFLERGFKHRLNALDKIDRVNAPILFFHGDRDKIIPIQLGRELYNAAPQPKEFVVIPGAGHNDTYWVGGKAYFSKIEAFVSKL
jgi:fermentation-respiration switch protein FrsA (DUF1100 family)